LTTGEWSDSGARQKQNHRRAVNFWVSDKNFIRGGKSLRKKIYWKSKKNILEGKVWKVACLKGYIFSIQKKKDRDTIGYWFLKKYQLSQENRRPNLFGNPAKVISPHPCPANVT